MYTTPIRLYNYKKKLCMYRIGTIAKKMYTAQMTTPNTTEYYYYLYI